jgi:hypothetical protein
MARHGSSLPAHLISAAGLCACFVWTGPDARAIESEAGAPTGWFMRALARVSQRPAVAYTAHRRLRAELLDSHEQGWMDVLAQFDPQGGLRYSVLSEGGSERIRRRALYTVLNREVDASRRGDQSQSAFSLDNYQFGISQMASDVIRIAMTPLRRDARLINGIATVHPGTSTLVQVEGALAKDPSFWVRDVRVALRYASLAGATLPVQLNTWARVRFFGPARLEIDVRYLTVNGRNGEPNQARDIRARAAPTVPRLLPVSALPE